MTREFSQTPDSLAYIKKSQPSQNRDNSVSVLYTLHTWSENLGGERAEHWLGEGASSEERESREW